MSSKKKEKRTLATDQEWKTVTSTAIQRGLYVTDREALQRSSYPPPWCSSRDPQGLRAFFQLGFPKVPSATKLNDLYLSVPSLLWIHLHFSSKQFNKQQLITHYIQSLGLNTWWKKETQQTQPMLPRNSWPHEETQNHPSTMHSFSWHLLNIYYVSVADEHDEASEMSGTQLN